MMNIIPVRIPYLFSQVTSPPHGLPEYSHAGRTPPSRATRAHPKPARRRPFMGMAMLDAGLGMLAGPGRALAQKTLGIDVSSYQGGGINWTSVKGAGIAFAWTKATEGTGYIDADFTINENNGKAANVYMGAYHFAHPELNSASAEACYFWNVAGNYIKVELKGRES